MQIGRRHRKAIDTTHSVSPFKNQKLAAGSEPVSAAPEFLKKSETQHYQDTFSTDSEPGRSLERNIHNTVSTAEVSMLSSAYNCESRDLLCYES